MAGPEDIKSGLPDVVRSTDRSIIIYQGAPQNDLDVMVGQSVSVMAWLGVLSLCIGVVMFCFWRVWSPEQDAKQVSPIYAEGRPLGLAKQVDERKQINAAAEGLYAYLDSIRASTAERTRSKATLPILNEAGGIDALRREWDQACQTIRDGLYDRRIGQLEARASELRRLRALRPDPAQLAQIDAELLQVEDKRLAQIENRRTDGDPTLRCVPASLAPVCAAASTELWCHPEKTRPEEFIEKAT